jgi:hypothetical protein
MVDTHSRAGEGVGGPNSTEGTDSLVLYVFYNPSTVEGINSLTLPHSCHEKFRHPYRMQKECVQRTPLRDLYHLRSCQHFYQYSPVEKSKSLHSLKLSKIEYSHNCADELKLNSGQVNFPFSSFPLKRNVGTKMIYPHSIL